MRNLLKAAAVIIAVIALFAFSGKLESDNYERATYDNCKQYELVPQEHLDRVPDGCIPQYYEAHKK